MYWRPRARLRNWMMLNKLDIGKARAASCWRSVSCPRAIRRLSAFTLRAETSTPIHFLPITDLGGGDRHHSPLMTRTPGFLLHWKSLPKSASTSIISVLVTLRSTRMALICNCKNADCNWLVETRPGGDRSRSSMESDPCASSGARQESGDSDTKYRSCARKVPFFFFLTLLDFF